MCFCFSKTILFLDNFRGTKFDLPDNIFIKTLVFQLAITFFRGTLRNVTSSHKEFPWCASTRMWSFKSLEVVCRKDYVLKFQNFITIENGFQNFQIFFILTTFYLHGPFKWSCRTSTTTPRVLETKSLRVAPFPFVRRAMGTANSFKTKRSKLKSWLRSGNQVAYGQ